MEKVYVVTNVRQGGPVSVQSTFVSALDHKYELLECLWTDDRLRKEVENNGEDVH